jgi:hypothetical protein
MPSVAAGHHREAGYAEGEHEAWRFGERNRPAYGIVVPITHRSTTDIGDHRCARIASRYLDSKER